MKKLYFLMVTLLVTSLSFGQSPIITIISDGDCSGGNPKMVEIYADGMVDFSLYSIQRQSNGGAWTEPGFNLAALGTVTDGFVYVYSDSSDPEVFATEYPSATTVVEDGIVNVNGDDGIRIVLDSNSSVVDQYGVDAEDGTGMPWEYADGFAKRVDGTGPDGGFTEANWTFSNGVLNGGGVCQGGSTFETIMGGIGTYSTVTNTDPTVNITFPFSGDSFDTGTTSVDVEWTVANAPGASVTMTVVINGGTPIVTNNAMSPSQITPLVDGDSVVVTLELVDGGLLDTDMVDFIIAYPCDLQVGTITETCDAITPATDDTYSVTIEYTGGGTSTYTIDTGGNGTVGGDNPTTEAAGTITISDITEGTDFSVTFTGNPTNSSCDFSRNINSPNCDPQLILPQYDTFTYADGSLVGNSEWQTTGGTAGDLLVTSGQAVVQHGNSEDVNLPFTPVTGVLYYAFDLTIPALAAPIGDGGGTDFEYFAHFKTEGFNFSSRLDIVAPTGAGDYSVGIATVNGAADATWASDLSYDTTYRVTVKYDQDTNISQLWVDASSEADTSIFGADESDPGDSIAAFSFRQSVSSDNEGILVDNLAITQTFAQTLSNNEFTIANGFKVYPNPTSLGYVNIASANSEAISVTVFDILGKQVINQTLNNNRLNVSALNSGVYIMKVTQNNASVTKKLIIK